MFFYYIVPSAPEVDDIQNSHWIILYQIMSNSLPQVFISIVTAELIRKTSCMLCRLGYILIFNHIAEFRMSLFLWWLWYIQVG